MRCDSELEGFGDLDGDVQGDFVCVWEAAKWVKQQIQKLTQIDVTEETPALKKFLQQYCLQDEQNPEFSIFVGCKVQTSTVQGALKYVQDQRRKFIQKNVTSCFHVSKFGNELHCLN